MLTPTLPPQETPARPKIPYFKRVAGAWLALIELSRYLRAGHDTAASSLTLAEREKRADHAVSLAVASQRATLALIGTHRRRTYAHDLVYGMHQLYRVFGKPWNAATEGGEHAHQDFKKYFANMVNHVPRGHSDSYQMMRQRLVGTSLKQRLGPTILPHSEYAARRCRAVIGAGAKRSARSTKRNPVKGMKGQKPVKGSAMRKAALMDQTVANLSAVASGS